MKTRNSSLVHLNKCLPKQTVNRRNCLSINQSNLASSIFGPPKNAIVTYSKSRPLQFVKKNHFHTPNTPEVLTPDELKTTGNNTKTETKEDIGKKIIQPQGGSYICGKTQTPSLESSNFQLTSAVGSALKSVGRGSSLALRNISNIPFEKTLSRTQCTPQRNDTNETQAKRKSSKKLTKRSLYLKKYEEISSSSKNNMEEAKNETLKRSRNSKSDGLQPKNATNYSAKSMSTCTVTSSKGSICSKQGHTLTSQSMVLCATGTEIDKDTNEKDVQSLDDFLLVPKASTFIESGEKVEVGEFFKNFMSPIIATEELSTPEEKQSTDNADSSSKNEKTLTPGQVLNNGSAQELNNYSNEPLSKDGPKTSTPTDQGKIAATLQMELDLSPILEANGAKEIFESNIVHEKTKKKVEKSLLTNAVETNIDKNTQVCSFKRSKVQKHDSLSPDKQTSLPLQASICIEDDSDAENNQDNITPELMQPIKSCRSSSKRKLEYSDISGKHDNKVCFLLDFKCSTKKPCKIWMRSECSSENTGSIPQDVLARI